MSKKLFILIILFLLVPFNVTGTDKDFGFTGEFKEIVFLTIPIEGFQKFIPQSELEKEMYSQTDIAELNALNIGLLKAYNRPKWPSYANCILFHLYNRAYFYPLNTK